MAGIIIDNEDGTHTLRFDFTALTQILQDTAEDGCQWYYNKDEDIQLIVDDTIIPFDALTLQQKVDALYKWMRLEIRRAAIRQHIINARDTAEQTAQSEADTKYISES
jgi:hypothetical protein